MPVVSGRPSPYKYETLEVHGPFHRKSKDGDDPRRLFAAMAESGELWGRGERNSPHLAALAFFGPLPDGKSGIEFFSLLEPHRPWGGAAMWFSPPHGQAREHDGWAKIDVVIKRASTDCI